MKRIHDLAGLGAAIGLTAAFIGVLDRFTSRAEIGPVLLYAGIAVLVGSIATLVFTSREYSLRSPMILGGGVLPFAAFALFLVWRIGLSAEQNRDCHDGDMIACRTLGERRFKRGKLDDARTLLESGCSLGDAESCLRAASVERLENGESTQHYADLIKKGCDLGSGISCYRMYLIIEEDPTTATASREVDSDHETALLRRACDLGYRPACVDVERSRTAR